MNYRQFLGFSLSLVIFAVIACKKEPRQTQSTKPKDVIQPRTREDEIPTLVFDIQQASGEHASADSQVYNCTYSARNKTAKFRVQFLQKSPPITGSIPVIFAKGKFLAVAGSDNAVLLEDLKKALSAKNVPKSSLRTKELGFTVAILGERLSRDSSGSFLPTPAGEWIATKIFLSRNGEEGEFFLNLNSSLGKGEFALKDSDYGDYVLKELATVL